MSSTLNRRSFLVAASSGATAFMAACKGATEPDIRAPNARLHSRRRSPFTTIAPGLQSLGLTDQITGRGGVLYVPSTYNARFPSPLVICLHGANGTGSVWADPFWLAFLDQLRVVMIAPDSRSSFTWDLMNSGAYGADVAFIDDALAMVFRACNIDPARIAVAGFSDGATEALGLGIMNGDFFSGVIGFSPGDLFAPFARGHTRAFVSHGTTDNVLSFTRTKNTLVPAIQALDVPVQFQSFVGGHQVPDDVALAGLTYAMRMT